MSDIPSRLPAQPSQQASCNWCGEPESAHPVIEGINGHILKECLQFEPVPAAPTEHEHVWVSDDDSATHCDICGLFKCAAPTEAEKALLICTCDEEYIGICHRKTSLTQALREEGSEDRAARMKRVAEKRAKSATPPAPDLFALIEKWREVPELDFPKWYMDNHDALHTSCLNQSDEPPYKDEYIFARAAWSLVEPKLRALHADFLVLASQQKERSIR
jgi:hypothetical protein